MHVITSGASRLDIDAYASAVAMAELMRLQDKPAIAASSGPLNGSIPESLRKLPVQLERDYRPSPNDVFTIVDLSEPEFFDLGANPDNVVAVIDHHLGFEDFWREKLGDKARIEFIGAACTQVYEIWQEAALTDKMSSESAILLACGILDNTLNLKAVITTDRDKTAYAALAKHANLSANWPEQYFRECQDYITEELKEALINDHKRIRYPSRTDVVGACQLALWDAQQFIQTNKNSIRQTFTTDDNPWYLNLIDIHTGRSVFYCENTNLQQWLEQLLGVRFTTDLATAERMWLRKEIMKQALTKEGRA